MDACCCRSIFQRRNGFMDWCHRLYKKKKNVFFFPPPSFFFFFCYLFALRFHLWSEKERLSLWKEYRHLIVQWSMLLLLHVSTETAVYLHSLPALFLNLHLSKHPEKELFGATRFFFVTCKMTPTKSEKLFENVVGLVNTKVSNAISCFSAIVFF